MRITKEEFREIYKNKEYLLNKEDILYTKPTKDTIFRLNLTSKIWRMNNLYSIINKKGDKIYFMMSAAQHKVYSASLDHSRLIILKSRQQGISTLWLVSFFDDCVFNPNISSGLMAQGIDESETLLKRIKILWDTLSGPIKTFLNISITKDNTKEVSFSNGSTMFVRTSFRSTTLQRLHISEFGKIANDNVKKAEEVLTGTLQTIAEGNQVIIESTAEGDNKYKEMWDTAMSYAGELSYKDFMPVFLSWVQDIDCVSDKNEKIAPEQDKYFKKIEETLHTELTQKQKNFWVMQHRELGKRIYQEYPSTSIEAFLIDREGTYYANLYLTHVRTKGREISNLFEPNLNVQVAADLGINDYFVLIFFQIFTDGFRIINDYRNSGEGIEHYCEIIKEYSEKLGYNVSKIILPHDAKVKELTSNITREQAFQKFGFENTYVVPKTSSIEDDIELVRQELKNMYVDTQAQYTIDCFLNYTKEWDNKRGIWKNTHLHNIYSHGADALRQMVKGHDKYMSYYQKLRKQNNYKKQTTYGYNL